MVAQWEPGTQYNLGDVVAFEGHRYKIIQPHRSQGDWTPPVTPALWGRLSDSDFQDEHHEKRHEEHREHREERHDEKAWDDHKGQTQQVSIPEEEQKKNWYDLTPERKKQLEIGGGLLAGAAVLGAGYLAYKHHNKSEEEKKADVWNLQGWMKDSQKRTEKYHKDGPKGPCTWVLANGKNIPEHAIKGGEEAGQPLYIARCYVDGGIHVGKASPRFSSGALIGYGGEEHSVSTYEVLVGDIRGLRWVDVKGRLSVEKLHAKPVEGGNEADGTKLYVIQTRYGGGVHPGKVSELMGGGMISYGGSEQGVEEYHVLCYA